MVQQILVSSLKDEEPESLNRTFSFTHQKPALKAIPFKQGDESPESPHETIFTEALENELEVAEE